MPIDRLRHQHFLLATSLLMGLLLPVQSAHAQPQQLIFEHYTIDDGMGNGSMFSILQDRQGFMWFGTVGFLSKFDGYSFTNYGQIPGDTTSFSGGFIYELLEDRDGFIWLGSSRGLNRIDPLTGVFTRYNNVPSDTTGLLQDHVNALLQDKDGTIWIGTVRGLLRFDPTTEAVTPYPLEPDPTSPRQTIVLSMVEDDTGTLWVGTADGLKRLDRKDSTIVTYTYDPLDTHSLPAPRVSRLVVDQSGTLWVGSLGLSRYDPVTDAFTTYYPDPEQLTSARTDSSYFYNSISAVVEDQSGSLWVGTRSGLLHFDPDTEAFTAYKHDPDQPGSLNEDRVTSLVQDRFGALWVGTRFIGLNRADMAATLIPTYVPVPNEPQNLRNYIQGILEDRGGDLWVGNLGGVLERTNALDGTVRRYQHDPSNPASLTPGNTQVMLEDVTGAIWIGTGLQYDPWSQGGLSRYDPETDTFTRVVFDQDKPTLQVLSLAESSSAPGILWIGTYYGLYRYDTRTKRATHYKHDPANPHSLSQNLVHAIHEDRSGTLWVGTFGGLNRLNRPHEALMSDAETEVFTHFFPSDLENILVAIYEDEKTPGILWIADRSGAGLVRFDTNTEEFSFFTVANSGLPSNIVYGILDDGADNLWLSTHGGLSRFDPETREVKNYGVSQGLLSREFNTGSFHKGRSGTLYFGGIKGYNAFKPEDISDNPYAPAVVITDVKLFNTSLTPAPGGVLEEPISTTNALTLAHNENDLSFDYVGLHYSNTEKIQYVYWLENYDDTWRTVGPQRTATYTNLDPGTYTFRVKAANSDGVWNEEGARMQMTVLPPWWRTWWAYLGYGLLFIGGVFAVDRVQRRRLLAKERQRAAVEKERLRAEAAERELEQAREIEAAYTELKTTKDRLVQQEKLASLGALTAGIAHEIKNPLNFVNNFAALSCELVDELEEETDPEEVQAILADLKLNATKIREHGERADSIVRSMMQHARGGDGQREAIALNAFVNEYVDLAYHGKRAQVPDFNTEIVRDYDASAGSVEVVPQEIGRVLINLLSNAFDAVREHAASMNGQYEPTVRVATCRKAAGVEIRVEDNGAGIPADVKAKIFEPFFTTKPTGSGTGLGLSMSYDIITQGHGGTLTMESEPGEGAAFVVTLPKKT